MDTEFQDAAELLLKAHEWIDNLMVAGMSERAITSALMTACTERALEAGGTDATAVWGNAGQGEQLAVRRKKSAGAKRAWDTTDKLPADLAEEAERLKAEISERPNRPIARIESDEDGGRKLAFGQDETREALNSIRLFKLSGSSSSQFAEDLMVRLSKIIKPTGDDSYDSIRLGGALSLLAGVDPANEVEATMALQMVQASDVSQTFLQRAAVAQYVDQAKVFADLGMKAQRTFALHAETLAKLRRNGEQVVKHVHVNEGGQAVIAQTVNTGKGAGA
ncbi:hypothetical protein [Sphingomicrobium nitratireducens]|uniref:hypothetical protein n=1 Tax=Sphingomicrobium nitratireducens TaxID=2964666 RepID=UPI00223FEFC8|nr:hypothetical protein [Sphingomicrobium nitratireducens]